MTTLWLGACSGDATGPGGGSSPEGTYSLSTIEAKPLPYAMYADTGYTLEIMSGTLAINSNGKWVSRITSRETVAGFVSTYNDSTFGTWSAASGSAQLTNTETNVASTATWTSSDVTVSEVDGSVTRKVVYKRN